MTLRSFFAIALCAVCTLTTAQPFTDKARPIRIVVPFGAGSGADLLMRAYARAMNEFGGVNVIVDNKPGAEGVIGLEFAKNAPPDGYTIAVSNLSTHVLNVYQQASLPYDPAVDFVPLVVTESVALVLNAGPSSKFNSISELLEAARARPGKLTYGSSTASTRLAMEILEHQANVKLLSVPYKTQAQATAALAAGEVDFLMTDVVTALPFYQSGRLRPIAVTSRVRIPALREVPTMREAGVKDFEFAAWSAIFAPARTPPEVVEKLRALLLQAGHAKYVKDVLAAKGSATTEMTATELTALVRTDLDRWGKLLREMKKSVR